MLLRNLAFDKGLCTVRRVDVPVVAVGNMTAGGTGKTPVVELLVTMVKARGLVPAVISRGYGRASRGVVIVADRNSVRVNAEAGGDEPVQLASRFPGVPVVVGEHRYDAALTAVCECGAEFIISDDGFQHRWLHRDCDLVVVDGTSSLWSEPMLPAGMRREPMQALKRAGIVALTGVTANDDVAGYTQGLRQWYDGPVITMDRSYAGLFEPHSGTMLPVEKLTRARCYCFSAIGNPGRFTRDVVAAGAVVAGERRFRDHHQYSHRELQEIVRAAHTADADTLLTTEKDLVRIQSMPGGLDLLGGPIPVLVPRLVAREASGTVLQTTMSDLIARKR
jgi:tetraacyldisaccharide 4'-kinase